MSEGKAVSEADLAGVMDQGGGKRSDAGRIFEGEGDDPGVVEDSTDAAEAHDDTSGPG